MCVDLKENFPQHPKLVKPPGSILAVGADCLLRGGPSKAGPGHSRDTITPLIYVLRSALFKQHKLFFYFYFLTTHFFSEAINYSSHGTEEPSFRGASATTSLSTTIASPPSWQHSESIFPPGLPLSWSQSSTGNFIQLSKQCRVST